MSFNLESAKEKLGYAEQLLAADDSTSETITNKLKRKLSLSSDRQVATQKVDDEYRSDERLQKLRRQFFIQSIVMDAIWLTYREFDENINNPDLDPARTAYNLSIDVMDSDEFSNDPTSGYAGNAFSYGYIAGIKDLIERYK